jgi:Ni/Co efflux regulator RcnB
MPHGGGGGISHGGGGFSRGGGMASFSHAAPSHSFSRGASERHGSVASFSHGSEVHRNTATLRGSESGRGLEAPRGSTAATFTHAHGARGAYGGMEHGTAATGGGPQHYAHDAHGFGKRPSNANNRPRNFDRGSYQRNASASARFHYGSYNAPHGYQYQRWSYGETLPSMYWARDYWLTSWWMFDLAIPPYGYEWVRYGDDALLVNVDTGQILQVDYGVFY